MEKNREILITEFEKENAAYFGSLNKEWIQKFYTLEPQDLEVLDHPLETVIAKGGAILFAGYQDRIIGTVGLRPLPGNQMEMIKLAVKEEFRGLGAGKQLCLAAMQKAEQLGAQQMVLYSNTLQKKAIALYRRLGFVERPVENGVYARANIKMEYSFALQISIEWIAEQLESYGRGEEEVRACLADIPKEIWDWSPGPGQWTIQQNIIHLADAEVHGYIRCRRILAEAGSQVLGYDQEKWASSLAYENQDAESALQLYGLLRKMTVALLNTLSKDQWFLTIQHNENGPMMLWQWLRCYENHTHILQIQRIHRAWQLSYEKDYATDKMV